MESSTLPTVVVISLGGTIAMSGDSDGVVPKISGAHLVEAVPSLHTLAKIEACNFRQIPGASLTLDDLYPLADEIDRSLDSGAAGVVVTQGTDTIEETAYVLDLLLDRDAPVVLTGAMRNASQPGADGPANLYAAVVVATSKHDYGGVVVVLGDEVHSARRVVKAHPTAPAAFLSTPPGPLALVTESAVVAYSLENSGPRLTIPRTVVRDSPRVPIVTVGLGDDGTILRNLRDVDAVVLETMGAGHLPQWLVEPAQELAMRIPVVMTSRTRRAPVLRTTYGFPGSERDLRSRGVLAAGLLDTFKARMLLLLLLRSGASHDEVRHRFQQLDLEAWAKPNDARSQTEPL